jgi:hypothetical protein
MQVVGVLALFAVAHGARFAEDAVACLKRDVAMRVLVEEKLRALGVPCEAMCKKMGAYPKCACPGFAGMPASASDNRACVAKYCQDPSSPCPNDPFVTCVSENTKVSALQWDTIFAQISPKNQTKASAANVSANVSASVVKPHRLALTAVQQQCDRNATGAKALVQEKARTFGVVCEDLCKKIGEYPKCQCPGFAGMPASADDNRACIVQYCQDPTAPCPNDPFTTCVKENTKVSALQWDAVFERVNQGATAMAQMLRRARCERTKKTASANASSVVFLDTKC